ncbi:MAG TPA: enoyl-CoA hydratase/isomerase family protein [Acidimicrobiales bacterium]|jgi:enoyl-CoA hydratase/carnithine racemase|nr:enoyl-CoA hydratase [Actinomycetota bacterium]MDP6061985.1 enoyl-CoA hydratase/isomerase family protein [Acidimicrobiales bacterium]MDP6213494.1 enoyl-CoA hydratase/isomerase family protein [Acidimicrobiales bacterium]MDP7209535.1 enoyl-CoA hydratase/isomerase family protein [Acidimicrobiales bacterium]HJL89877.1 enoyl-CoA hydratase/isomerase family protein [Acidimicrobiales bacterium]|tara:strand:- start:5100 stop:5852 length:753 start_codon:yes stop_codon:yes gene_type:complete
MPDQDVLLSVTDGVASIVLNRPERRNAITGPLVEGLVSAFTSVGERDDVGVVLFHGAEGAFCSGLDLKEFNADPHPPWLSTFGESNTRAHRALFDCPVPVVVALERYAINGGAAYALGGDLIVAGSNAFLQVGEVRLGMPAPNNLAWLLARHPPAVAEQLVLSGRQFHGPDLHRLGVAFDVVDDDDVLAVAEALAGEVAGFPTDAARRMKAAIRGLSPSADVGSSAAWFERAADQTWTAAVPGPPGGGED